MEETAQPALDNAAQSLRAAHQHLVSRADLQFQFLARDIPPPRPAPRWLQAIFDFLGHLANGASPVLQVLFWGLIILAVGGILFLIAREAGAMEWAGAKRRKGRMAQEEYRPEAQLAQALLADADALARRGRFEEAVHVLLLRSIEDVQRFRPQSVAPAATSRDIARLEALPEVARRAFGSMAAMVETSLFGGRAVGADGYAQCRQAYEDFAFPRVWA